MDLEEAFAAYPHLWSPARLAHADLGEKFQLPPHLDLLNDELVKVGFKETPRLMVNVPFQHGKLLAHETPIFTPGGWRRHGDLVPSDLVFSPEGTPVAVEEVSPEGMATLEVEFTDGSTIRCHEKHEWFVRDRRAGRWRILETGEMMSRPLKEEYDGSKRYLFQLQRNLPLQGRLSLIRGDKLWVPPYVLGAWLGDGQSDRPVISHAASDLEVVAAFQSYYPISSRWVQRDTGVCYARFHSMKADLESAGVLNDKHIPEVYLRAGVEERQQLLAGLIDTDGHWSERAGQYRFTNTNRRLIDGTAFLARSLGFKVGKIVEVEPAESSSGIVGKKKVYVLSWQGTGTIPCRLPRKRPKKLREACKLAIAAIRPCKPVPGRCIQVEGGMYLVGESLVPTHNSTLSSHYFPAWMLLLWPETRILLAAHEQDFATQFGSKVKDVLEKFGPALGVNLKQDSQAKDEWVIEGHEGGMVCRGMQGSVQGRPGDLFIIDDPIRDDTQAVSPTIMERHWSWFCTTAYTRLGPDAPIVIVSTRWVKNDLCGRLISDVEETGEVWKVIKLRALAEADDPLGRKPGEPLWPWRVPLRKLHIMQKRSPRWFRANYQQEPEDAEGTWFKPRKADGTWNWPLYKDLQNLWSLPSPGGRLLFAKDELTILITVDWAYSKKQTADYTAMGAFALTPGGELLILDVINERFRPEELAPALAGFCRTWHPDLVAVETGHPTLAQEYRRHKDIPEVRWLEPRSKSKLQRALPAIVLAENGRLYLPEVNHDWREPFVRQLAGFTGDEKSSDHDDMVDMCSWAAHLAGELRGGGYGQDWEPEVLTPGRRW
jgi:predicted phage terminase large subunit-like protein